MICDRAERRAGGTSAPVFGGGIFRLSPQGRLSYRGDFISLPPKWLYNRVGRRRLRRFAFCRADPVGQPSPALRLRRLFGGSGVARSVQLSGGFLSPSRKNGFMIGGGRRRLRRSAFCRADPAGQPSPASRLRRLFGGSGVARSVQLSGGILSPSRKNGLMIGGGRRRLRRSAFCRADPAGQPSPRFAAPPPFFGESGATFLPQKEENSAGLQGQLDETVE